MLTPHLSRPSLAALEPHDPSLLELAKRTTLPRTLPQKNSTCSSLSSSHGSYLLLCLTQIALKPLYLQSVLRLHCLHLHNICCTIGGSNSIFPAGAEQVQTGRHQIQLGEGVSCLPQLCSGWSWGRTRCMGLRAMPKRTVIAAWPTRQLPDGSRETYSPQELHCA